MKDHLNVPMNEKLDAWGRGEHLGNVPDNRLLALEEGAEVGSVLAECTVCPLPKIGKCPERMTISSQVFNPGAKEERGEPCWKTLQVLICTLGCTNRENCVKILRELDELEK